MIQQFDVLMKPLGENINKKIRQGGRIFKGDVEARHHPGG
jgi:hypothetical protein